MILLDLEENESLDVKDINKKRVFRGQNAKKLSCYHIRLVESNIE